MTGQRLALRGAVVFHLYSVLVGLARQAAKNYQVAGYEDLISLAALEQAFQRAEVRAQEIQVLASARADRAVSPDMVFLPFAYVEAAANILTNPAVDPYGKIPEFKFSAVKVEAAHEVIAAE